jgi:hypothetical protein
MLGWNGTSLGRVLAIHSQADDEKVGNGMLAAAVSGEVFASPSTKQVMAAIKHTPSDAGIILCITNYTGDNLHFGLAKEKALGMGKKVAILRMTDDVALGRQQTSNLGRRGLAGNLFGEIDFCSCFQNTRLTDHSLEALWQCFRSRLRFRHMFQHWPGGERQLRYSRKQLRSLSYPRS